MQKKILPTTTSRRTTERKRTEDNETEQRRDERVLLDRVVDRLGGLSGRPSGRPVSDLPKTPPMGPGPAGAQNRHILNRTSIKKSSDSDGRRIREFSSSRTRLDLLLFRALGGTDFRVPFLRVFFSRIRFVSSKTLRSRILKPTSTPSWRAIARGQENNFRHYRIQAISVIGEFKWSLSLVHSNDFCRW